MRGYKRVVAVCALLAGGVTGWAAGAQSLPCAEWVSTGGADGPGVGHLIGTSVVKMYWAVEIAGITYHVEESFEVGTYEFDGVQIRLDCRNYSEFQ